MQVVDHGVADGDGAGDLLRVGPEEDDGGFKHAVLLAEEAAAAYFLTRWPTAQRMKYWRTASGR